MNSTPDTRMALDEDFSVETGSKADLVFLSGLGQDYDCPISSETDEILFEMMVLYL